MSGGLTNLMGYGYSVQTAELNRGADRHLLGVQLGKVCIKQNIPVSEVAAKLGVSRQTIYNWFGGFAEPNSTIAPKVSRYLAKLST